MDSDKKKPSSGQEVGSQNADQQEQAPTKPDGSPPEFYGPKGPEPTRYGDWEQKGEIITGDECLISKVMKLLLFSKTMATSTGLPISGMSASNDESGNEENPPKKMKADLDAIDVEACCLTDNYDVG